MEYPDEEELGKEAEAGVEEVEEEEEEEEEEEDEIVEFEEDVKDDKVVTDTEDEGSFPAVYSAEESGEVDYDKIGQLKMKAAEAAAGNELDGAVELYTEAIKLHPSALSYAKRAGTFHCWLTV